MCRASCRVIRRTPARSPTRPNSSLSHSGLTARPSSSHTTYPLAWYASPAASFSAAWRLCSAASVRRGQLGAAPLPVMGRR